MIPLTSIVVIAAAYVSAYIVSVYALAMYIDPDDLKGLFPKLSRRRRELFEKITDDPRVFVQIAAVYKSFALVLIAGSLYFLLAGAENGDAIQAHVRLVIALVVAWFVFVIVVEYLPRLSSRTVFGPRTLGAFWLVVLIYVLFSPLVNLYRRSLARSSVASRVSEEDKEEIVERAIETLADHAGIGEAIVEEDEKEMIGQIFRLDQTTVREIMIPRIDMVAIERSSSFSSIRELAKRDGHSRYPVYDGTIDKVVGLLYLKDIFNTMPQPGEVFEIDKYLRPPFLVPESKIIGELLKEFKSNKRHIAIVIDEYGGVAGLITLEDILEEIVGDIQDEHDKEEAELVSLGGHEYRVEGGVLLDKFLGEIGLEYDHDEFETVGGLMYDLFGSVPKAGEHVRWHNLDMEVLRLRGQRIVSIKVRVLPQVKPA